MQGDIQDFNYEDSSDDDENEEDDELDPIALERKLRAKKATTLRRTAGEPIKPQVTEVLKLQEGFIVMLRMVLAE